MYILNKIVGAMVDPMMVAAAGALLALSIRLLARQKTAASRWAMRIITASAIWLWVWSMPFTTRFTGAVLEREYLAGGRVASVDDYPQAAAIVLHGGGMGGSEKLSDGKSARGYAEMWTSADRVWMAARLWRAGKAPIILVTGGKVRMTTAGLLEDFGVPTNAVVYAEAPRNTEEEARYVGAALGGGAERARVLAVTSAFHMRRTMMMYGKYAPGVEAIAAPCDFENTLWAIMALGVSDFLPRAEALLANRVALHEWAGLFGYRYFRK